MGCEAVRNLEKGQVVGRANRDLRDLRESMGNKVTRMQHTHVQTCQRANFIKKYEGSLSWFTCIMSDMDGWEKKYEISLLQDYLELQSEIPIQKIQERKKGN